MKTLATLLWTVALAFGFSGSLQSQNAPVPRTPLEALQQLKTQNAVLLEKQTATLIQLDELAKEAQQIKFLAKRS